MNTREKSVNEIITILHTMHACGGSIIWLKTQESWASAWANCERGDWMLWLLGKLSGPAWGEKRKPLVLAACECARLALPYTKDERVLKCIEIVEAWTRGEASLEQVRAAADAADAAADADAAAAAADAAAAAAAAYAAADAAADAYADAAAAAAAYAAAADAARSKILKQCADIVRRHYPIAPNLEDA